MKNKILLIALGFFLCFALRPVFADNFDSVANVSYVFNQSGSAQVTSEISIINNVDNLYVSEYSITLMSDSFSNFIAYDNKGTIVPVYEKSADKTIVRLKLNDTVVGVKQINSFIFRYQSRNYLTPLGPNKEIRLPKIDQIDNYVSYSISISVPYEYGRLSASTPKPDSINQDNNQLILKYIQSNTLKNGIYLLFGEYQIYNVSYKVELNNDLEVPVRTSFPLIPNTSYQDTFQKELSPLPDEVNEDGDGNWLAFYILQPRQKLEINGQTLVKVYPKSRSKTKLNDEQIRLYTQPTNYWQSDDPIILSASKNLKTISDIYRYVVKSLSYNYDEINPYRSRIGAAAAINNPNKSVCTEYTDLFIALARSIGIPAREHQGYAYSQDEKIKSLYDNSDILHAWPEYYDQSTESWLMVDPTFGDTSGGIDYLTNFDNSHISFVIHGINDKQPIPLGGYHLDPQGKKYIFVTILEVKDLPSSNNLLLDTSSFPTSFSVFPKPIASLFYDKNTQGPFFSLFKQPVKFFITNSTGYPLILNTTSSNNVDLNNNAGGKLILPWQKETIDGTFTPEEKTRNYYYQGDLIIDNIKSTFTIPVLSSLTYAFYLLLFLGMLLFSWLLYRLFTQRKTNLTKTLPNNDGSETN